MKTLHFPTKHTLWMNRDGPYASNGVFDPLNKVQTFLIKHGAVMKKLVLGINFFHKTEERLRQEIDVVFTQIISVGNTMYDDKKLLLSPYIETSKDKANINTSLLSVCNDSRFDPSLPRRNNSVCSYHDFIKEYCTPNQIKEKLKGIIKLNLLMMIYIAITNNKIRAAELRNMKISKDVVVSAEKTPSSLYILENEKRSIGVVVGVVKHKSLELKNRLLPRFIFDKQTNKIALRMFGQLRIAATELDKNLKTRRDDLFIVEDPKNSSRGTRL